MAQKIIDRVTMVAALIMFVGAVYVLYRVLEDIRLSDVLEEMQALPRMQLLGATGLTAASYLLLSGYDFLALAYARCGLRLRQVVLASFVAFAFTNTLGFALVSGGSVRLRIYSGFGLTPVQIGEVVAFATLTYGLGVVAVGGLIFAFDSAEIASVLNLPRPFSLAIGIVMLMIMVGYLAAVAARSKPIALGGYRLRLPTVRQGLMQIALASVDQVVAGAVLYVLLPPGAGTNFVTFLAMYVVAAPLSMISMVPGGLGVFETALLVLMAHTPKAAFFASLVVYRCIYFLLPLVVAIACDAIYELNRASGGLDRPP